MDFNLKKLEQLNDILSTDRQDQLLVNVLMGDGSYESKYIEAGDLLSTSNLDLVNAQTVIVEAAFGKYTVDITQIQTQEDANIVFAQLLKILGQPAKQKTDTEEGQLGLMFPNETLEYDQTTGELGVAVPEVDKAVQEEPGVDGVAGLMFPDQTFTYDSATGKLTVNVPDIAEGGATGVNYVPGIMYPNDTLDYDNTTGELGVTFPEATLAQGGPDGPPFIPGVLYPNDTLDYNNATGELGVTFPDATLAEGGATGANYVPGILYPNDTLDYDNATGELGVTFPETPLATQGATGIPGIMYPNDTLEYDNATGELGVIFPDVPLAVQETTGVAGVPGVMFPDESFVYTQATGKLTARKAFPGATGMAPVPGVMYPDATLRYNYATGELGVTIPSGTEFKGVIGTDSSLGQVESPSTPADAGHFYIVGEGEDALGNKYVLNGDWSSVSGQTVDVGDVVIMDDTLDWVIVPSVLAFGVVEIVSNNDALTVDSTNSQYPVLDLKNAEPGATGIDGLMSKEDKEKLDDLDGSKYVLSVTSGSSEIGVNNADPQNPILGFDGSDYLVGATSPTEALDIDFTDPQVPVFSIENATTSMDGLMSKEDKEKLDDLDTSIYLIGATSATTALDIDYTNDPQEPIFSIENATPGDTGMDGLMSKEDKEKLDGLDGDFVQISGDTMTGSLTTPRLIADGTSGARVIEAKASGTTSFWVNATGQARTNYELSSSSEEKTLTTKKYVDDIDGSLKNDIISLQDEIDTLRNTIVRGEYEITSPGALNDDPTDGKYYLQRTTSALATSFDEATLVIISKKDLNNISISYVDVNIDDIVSVFDKEDDSFGSYLIVSKTDNPSYIIFEVEHINSRGNPSNLARVFFYENVKGSTIDDLYLEKTGGVMTGSISFDVLDRGVFFQRNSMIGFKDDATLQIGTGLNSINMEPNIILDQSKTEFKNKDVFYDESILDPKHITNKGYVDTELAKKVSKTGDTMTGGLLFESTNTILDIKDDHGTGNLENRFIKVKGTNKFQIRVYPGQDNTGGGSNTSVMNAHWSETDNQPELVLKYLKDPTDDDHAVTLGYLNTKIEEINDLIEDSIDDIPLEDYLPLTGGVMRGQITTNSLIKSTRGSYSALEIKPNDSEIRATWNTNGRIDITMASESNAAIRTVGAINVKKTGVTDMGGANNFSARHDYVRYYGQQSNNDDLATVKYVTDRIPEEGTIPVQTTARTGVGQMWLNPNDNVLYIKKS